MVGPIIGFGLAYVMLSIYIDPTLTPVIAYKDPRWLGAWWLGWIVLGVLKFIFAALIGMFPKDLPKKIKPIENNTEGGEKCKLKPEFEEKIEMVEKEGELKRKNELYLFFFEKLPKTTIFSHRLPESVDATIEE